MKNIKHLNMKTVKIITVAISFSLASCGSLQTFNEYARAGDTVAIATGMKGNFSKDNISATITPSVGADIVIDQGDPAIRAVINLYPDPASSLIVSRETDQDITPNARTYESTTRTLFTGLDKDFFQTTVFLDLPGNLPIGTTNIEISNGQGTTASSNLVIIEGTGGTNPLNAEIVGPLTSDMLDVLARVEHYVIEFSTTTLPYAIELQLSHDPDSANGGSGKAMAINPTGYTKNLTWTDDGNNMHVILLPAQSSSINSEKDFKFYIAGGVTNLSIIEISGYDIDGVPVTGITGNISYNN